MKNADPQELLIEPQTTPNPNSVRFVVNRTLLERGGADFRSAAKAERSPLARRLLAIKGVQGAFIGPNFVTVTGGEEADWGALISQIEEALRAHVAAGEPAIEGGGDAAAQGHSEVEKGIIRVIDEEIRPAVAMDGGDIVFGGYENGVVSLYLRGACAGCPSSIWTLKMGVERRLKEEFPEIVAVEAVM